MNQSNYESKSTNESCPSVGLLAYGCAGNWDVSVDESTSGPEKWFAQIEGPSLYLYFEIKDPSVIDKCLGFLRFDKSREAKLEDRIELGRFHEHVVELLRDDEFDDRVFFSVMGPSPAVLRTTLNGEDCAVFARVLQQVVDDMNT